MTPTIVLDGDERVRVVVGAAGGPDDHLGDGARCCSTCRLEAGRAGGGGGAAHPRSVVPRPARIEAEIPRDVSTGLEKRGHKVKVFPHIGTVNVLVRTDKGIEAGAEPRSPSPPAGY